MDLDGENFWNVTGIWETVYAWFPKWRDEGVLEHILRTLSADAEMENFSKDSTSVKQLRTEP